MIDLVQGSPEWLAARAGKVTGSRVSDVIARTKTGWGASRDKYAGDLIAERLTGAPAARYTNAAMSWGHEQEPVARAAYEFFADADVSLVGFVPHPAIQMTGASPDGLVGDLGLVEIKCPETHTHIDTLLGQNVPSKYVTQMQWQMACTGRAWCDFASFDPRMPAHMQLFVRRVVRDDTLIADLEREVAVFLREIDARLASLNGMYGQRAAA